MWPDRASLVLATFAETKVARLPGRNPASLEPTNHSSEANCVLERSENILSGSIKQFSDMVNGRGRAFTYHFFRLTEENLYSPRIWDPHQNPEYGQYRHLRNDQPKRFRLLDDWKTPFPCGVLCRNFQYTPLAPRVMTAKEVAALSVRVFLQVF